MPEMTLRDAMFSLRAMRRLRVDPVPEEDLRFLIEAATQAPNGENQQNWRFVVVQDADQRRRIGEAYQELAANSVRPVVDGEAGEDFPESELFIYRNAWRLAQRIGDAPALIFFCVKGPIPDDRAWGATYYGSIFPAAQNLMLAARSRGLGSVLTTLHLLDEKPFREILALPEGVNTIALIPVGYPEGKFGPPLRDPAPSVTHWDRWNDESPSGLR